MNLHLNNLLIDTYISTAHVITMTTKRKYFIIYLVTEPPNKFESINLYKSL